MKDYFSYDKASGEIRCSKTGKVKGGVCYSGYLRFTHKSKYYFAHRVAWFLHHGYWPDCIDHINHNKTDNRIENLRDVTRLENNMNQSLRSSNKVGFQGVHWCKYKRKFHCQIRIGGKKVNLGRFDCLIDAVARCIRAKEKHGYHENHGQRT